MKAEAVNLFHIPINQLCQLVKESVSNYEYNYERHTIHLIDDAHNELGQIRLPLHYAMDESLLLKETPQIVLYISIESGNAAICIMEDNVNTYHTTIGAYMTRKKQGFSQIKYLNKKGKSRAGSRVRLAGTITFFENINIILTELFERHSIDRIALNCSTSLIPYLYQSKVQCPFNKDDMRLYKIPLHIASSSYTNLYGAIKKLMAPILSYKKEDVQLLHAFLQPSNKQDLNRK